MRFTVPLDSLATLRPVHMATPTMPFVSHARVRQPALAALATGGLAVGTLRATVNMRPGMTADKGGTSATV